MSAQLLIAPEVSLPPTLPAQLPPPSLQLDQILKFGKVPAGDFGRVVGIVYAAGATVQATGYHYLLVLDEQSKSRRELGIRADWIFEDDASPVAPEQPSTKPNGHSSQQGHGWQQQEE
jgi:hypothetical protein